MEKLLTDKEYKRMTEEYDKVKIRCKCGHRIIVPMWVKRQLCHWCNHYVYRDKRMEFKETIKTMLKEVI